MVQRPAELQAIALRLDKVRKTILQAADQAKRDPSTITLIAVSKTRSADEVRAAYDAGQRDFGENYVQELVKKAQQLSELHDIRWHMIGHLQSNKVRSVVGIVHTIHTIDRASVITELGKRYAATCADGSTEPVNVLVEVALGSELPSEQNKTGAHPRILDDLIHRTRQHTCLRLKGLMTVAPVVTDFMQGRKYFEQLRDLAQAHHLTELSMGMSDDFSEAIGCGATMIRVGQAIFGPR